MVRNRIDLASTEKGSIDETKRKEKCEATRMDCERGLVDDQDFNREHKSYKRHEIIPSLCLSHHNVPENLVVDHLLLLLLLSK